MSVVALIPAHGGSEGLPRTNLAKVGGCSLAARAARRVAEIDRILVSSDDVEIAAGRPRLPRADEAPAVRSPV